MKLNRFFTISLAAAAIAASCGRLDVFQPQGGTLLESQVKQTVQVMPQRVDASFVGMYTYTGRPLTISFSSSRPDNFGFIAIAFSADLEAADCIMPDSGYNWFSVCGELSSRSANYANPYIRYAVPYNEIATCNTLITTLGSATNTESVQKLAQVKAMRAFSYLNLAPYFQFPYDTHADAPCVPVVTEETLDFTNNPRATVAQVYDLIISDLTFAIDNLAGFDRGIDKAKIDQQVAYGLRARAYLNMGEWQKAYDDAVKAAEGFTPATIAELSAPGVAERLNFKDINEHNWIWGYDMTRDVAEKYPYATSSSWIRSFSANGYSAATQCYVTINNLLYDKIPDSDVRKGWWVDENLESPLLNGWAWPGYSDVANADDGGDTKTPFLPLTNVKFGCNTIGTVDNDEDWPFIRVEEMILTQAECLARLSREGDAKTLLEDFIGTYREPGYKASEGGRTLLDEIWFQRRVELWGEGLSNMDTRRLHKPLVRFHGGDANSNQPDAFRFNMAADDGWWLMRFPQDECNTNLAVIDNEDGTAPTKDQLPELRDGVTD